MNKNQIISLVSGILTVLFLIATLATVILFSYGEEYNKWWTEACQIYGMISGTLTIGLGCVFGAHISSN